MAGAAAAVLTAGLVAGCGGGKRQDADEPSGTYKVQVVSASFPQRQSLASPSEMRLTVKNTDSKTVPDVSVTLLGDDPNVPTGGFYTRSDAAGLADPNRAVWVVDQSPRDGDTAYVSTWALGALRPGATRTFTWRVTPMITGMHVVRWRVGAGLAGKAHAQTASGDEPSGTFRVSVSGTPAQATVDPKTGAVVRDASK